MILVILLIIIWVLIGITLYFILKNPKPFESTESSVDDPLFQSESCIPKLDEVSEYAATYIKDSDGKCVVNSCKPGYTFYYGDPKSINKFRRCQ
jgi:hypothetical protein